MCSDPKTIMTTSGKKVLEERLPAGKKPDDNNPRYTPLNPYMGNFYQLPRI